MTRVRVWLSHDGYRDPDDNLSLLLGGAYARDAARGSDVQVRGMVFGDTKDGGQYYTLNPTGKAPGAFGRDDRYGEVEGNRQAAGNYAFYKEYGEDAVRGMAPAWKLFDLLASDNNGKRAWNFDASSARDISSAARAIAGDIADAVDLGYKADGDPVKLVVYSAGGGANAAAEAIGYLLNKGYSEAELVGHFAVVQHGNNWVTNYEPEARELTRDFTIAISNQNYGKYANGASGPGLKHAISTGADMDGGHFGEAFDKALKVATGVKSFQDLPDEARFRSTRDASDAGSHAFAVDGDAVLDALDGRLSGNEEMRKGYDWAHRVDEGGGTRAREIYAGFNADDVRDLLKGKLSPGGKGKDGADDDDDDKGHDKGGNDRGNGDNGQDNGQDNGGSKGPGSGASGSGGGDQGGGSGGGRLVVSLADGDADRESIGGSDSEDLDLGMNRSDGGGGDVANTVTLRFGDPAGDMALGAEIRSAYLFFEAKWQGEAGGSLRIDLDDGGSGGGSGVTWKDMGGWTPGESYRSPDIATLVSRALAEGEALSFEITGTGRHVAHSQESDGLAPLLVIDWDVA